MRPKGLRRSPMPAFAPARSAARRLALAALLAIPVHAFADTGVEYTNSDDFPGAPAGHFFYSADPAEQAVVDLGIEGRFFRTGRTFATGGVTPVCRFYGSVTPGPNS